MNQKMGENTGWHADKKILVIFAKTAFFFDKAIYHR